jgi:peptide/nickel transport system permease protein
MPTIPEFVPRTRRRLQKPFLAVTVLAVAHGLALFAGFFAPYEFERQNRSLAFAPPSRIHFFDLRDKFHVRPFFYRQIPSPTTFNQYQEDRTLPHPIHFFVSGAPYKLFGIISCRRHLFGTDHQTPVFLIGSDEYGRDQFSRLLYGAKFSLIAGLLATAIALSLGLLLGGLAGYYGRLADELIMRAAEVFVAVPWLYLLLAVRAALPLHLDPSQVFFLLIAITGVIGWARPARLIRGIVLSAKERDYVLAARGFGASDFYLLRRHILPQVSSVALTQTVLFIPQYILAEVTLSFFGLGVSEPAPSWGNMLASLQQYFVLESCWWMFAPAVALVAVLLAYNRLLSFYASNVIQL